MALSITCSGQKTNTNTYSGTTNNKGYISESELSRKVQRLMDSLTDKNLFSGTVIVANKETILFEKAYGEASKRFHVKNDIDTKFNLASMNKMFTSVAIMQLVEKGTINLDEYISNYIDESWLPTDITEKVTVRHLLSHTSGLRSYFNRTFKDSSKELYRDLIDFRPLVNNDRLYFDPGEQFQYSNTGMLLLGIIIQEASGEDYFEYIHKHICEPLGMDNTDYYEMDEPVENLAIGYISTENNASGWTNNIYQHVMKGGPAGGGFSTVRDLHKFSVSLLNEKLVTKSSLKLLWTDHANSNYGFGFEVNDTTNGKRVGHSGGFPGVSANLDIYEEKGYIVIVLSNYDRALNDIPEKIGILISRVKVE
jgi:CubicO group peptidase (beta-lactamase class C family)